MSNSIFTVSLAAILALRGVALAAQDDKTEWGNLDATFLYDGEPPQPVEITIDKDRDFIKGPLFDPSLRVDPKTKGIANVVVWLDVAKGGKLPPIHPSYDEPAKRPVTLSYRNGEFEPHIVVVRTKQELVLRNADKIGYAAKGDFFKNTPWHELMPAGAVQRKVFDHSESRPCPIACLIHPWMYSLIVIKDHPYAAISQQDGKIQIKNLPVGTHSFAIWHERMGIIKDAQRDGKPENWPDGLVTIDIKPGDNDLGKIEFKPARRD
jgi:hypothetical protein